jgi:transcriptional regulator with XRE-family HTH domain
MSLLMCASEPIRPVEAASAADDSAETAVAGVQMQSAVHGKRRMTAAAGKKSKTVQATDRRIGLKMRHTRLLKGLTLRKLADLAECSESLLSRIENGTANPSIKTMHRVALALEMPVSGLFQDGNDDDMGVVLRQGERPMVQAGQGKRHRLEALIPSGRGNLLSAYINDIEPGGGSEGVIRHEGEEFGYVLDGEIELVVGRRKYQLSPGDSFYFRSERPHSYTNNRKNVARILWLNTPPTF